MKISAITDEPSCNGLSKQKQPCILEDSIIPGESFTSIESSTFWACMTACWKSDRCCAGSYISSSAVCQLKAGSHFQAEQTVYSKANKVKSFDFTCSTKISQPISLGVKLKNKNSRNSDEIEEERNEIEEERKMNTIGTKLNSAVRNEGWPTIGLSVGVTKPTEPLCVYKGATYPDGTIDSKNKDTSDDCATACVESKDCVVATYIGSAKKCILKSEKHKALIRTEWAVANKVKTFDFENPCVGVRPKSPIREAREKELGKNSRNGKPPCRYHNAVLVGGTFFSADATSIEKCGEICLKKPACSAVTFLFETEKCHVKNKLHKGPTYTKFAEENGAVSLDYNCDLKAYHDLMLKFPTERKIHGLKEACRYKNRQISGQVVEEVDLVSELECATACLSSQDCFGLTYLPKSMTCYHKGEGHNGAKSLETLGVISYDFTLDCLPEGQEKGVTPPVVKVCEYLDMMYRGSSVIKTAINVVSSENCVELCSEIPKCKAVTYLSGTTSSKCFMRGQNRGPLYPSKSTETRKVVSYDLDCRPDVPNNLVLKKQCLLKDQVFTGGFLEKHTDVPSSTICFEKCSSLDKCVAATYAPRTKSCSLRDSSREEPKVTEFATINKLVSYCFLCHAQTSELNLAKNMVKRENAPLQKKSCLLKGQVFRGGLLERKTDIMSSDKCFELCSTDMDCVAATFSPNNKLCVLRDSSREDPTETKLAVKSGIVSYDFLCDEKTPKKEKTGVSDEKIAEISDMPTPKQSCLLKGQVFRGGLLERKTDIMSSDKCFELCSTDMDCVAATFSPNNKLCVLKDSSREDPRENKLAVESGIVSYDFLCDEKTPKKEKTGVSDEKIAEISDMPTPKQSCLLKGQVFRGGLLERKTDIMSSDKCFELCSTDMDCVAATFSPNNKLCVLKDSSREDPRENKLAVESGIVSYDFLCDEKKEKTGVSDEKIAEISDMPTPKQSCLLKGQVFRGGLLERKTDIMSSDKCFELCSTDMDCVAATFSPNNKLCVLKDSSREDPRENKLAVESGIVSYDFLCDEKTPKKEKTGVSDEKIAEISDMPTPKQSCLLKGQVFRGGLLERKTDIMSSDKCFELCSTDMDCVAATFSPNNKLCVLKDSSREDPRENKLAVESGIVSYDFLCDEKKEKTGVSDEKIAEISDMPTPKQSCLLKGQVFRGGLLERKTDIMSSDKCFELCSTDMDCVAATFSPNNKLCVLKDSSREDPRENKLAVESGIVSYDFLCDEKTPKKEKTGVSDEKIAEISDMPTPKQSCLLKGQVFRGGLLERKTDIMSSDKCFELCSTDMDCVAATFSPNNKLCVLKDSSREDPRENKLAVESGIVSYDFLCDEKKEKTGVSDEKIAEISDMPTSKQSCLLKGQVFRGGLLERKTDIMSSDKCFELCSTDMDCVAATFSPNNKLCVLKDSSREDPRENKLAVESGIVSYDFLCDEKTPKKEKTGVSDEKIAEISDMPTPKQSCLLKGQVFRGGLLERKTDIMSSDKCFELCSTDMDCVAATFSPNNKLCVLKDSSREDPRENKLAVESGIVSYDFLCDEKKEKTGVSDEKIAEISDMPTPKQSCLLKGQVFRGGLLERKTDIMSSDKCFELCSTDMDCVAATFSPNNKLCVLKDSSREDPRENKLAVESGIVSYDFLCDEKTPKKEKTGVSDEKIAEISDMPTPKQSCLLKGQVFRGGLLERKTDIMSSDKCFELCSTDMDCVAATFSLCGGGVIKSGPEFNSSLEIETVNIISLVVSLRKLMKI